MDRDGDSRAHACASTSYAVDDTDHVEIKIPGDERTVIDRQPSEYDKMRFARQWAFYNGTGDEFAGQTRIETVAWIDPGNAREMRRWNIQTVEQLAAMSDSQIDGANMLGLLGFRARAQQHLAEQQKSSAFDEVKAENAALQARLSALEAKLSAPAPRRAAEVLRTPEPDILLRENRFSAAQG